MAATPAAERPKTSPKSIKFLFGGLAGMGATVFVQPLDLVKNRMQLSGEGAKGREYPTSLHALLSILRREGLRGIYTGLSAGLLRQATYTTTRLGIYSVLLERWGGGGAGGSGGGEGAAPPPPLPGQSGHGDDGGGGGGLRRDPRRGGAHPHDGRRKAAPRPAPRVPQRLRRADADGAGGGALHPLEGLCPHHGPRRRGQRRPTRLLLPVQTVPPRLRSFPR